MDFGQQRRYRRQHLTIAELEEGHGVGGAGRGMPLQNSELNEISEQNLSLPTVVLCQKIQVQGHETPLR